MAHTNSRLKVPFARPVPPFNDKSIPTAVFIEAGKRHLWNSWNSHSVTPRRQQCHKSPLKSYLFYSTHERVVHISNEGGDLRSAPNSPMLSKLAPSTGRSIPRVMFLRNQKTPGTVWQRNKVPSLESRALLSSILLNRVGRWKTDRRTQKASDTRTRNRRGIHQRSHNKIKNGAKKRKTLAPKQNCQNK